jgi:hypothetical protein
MVPVRAKETCAMTRYFFDYVTENQVLHDYQGRYYDNTMAAREYAELLAIDLEHMGEWTGWTVSVRDVHGKESFSVQVLALEAA